MVGSVSDKKTPRVVTQNPTATDQYNASSYPDFDKAFSGFDENGNRVPQTNQAQLPVIDLDTGADQTILVPSTDEARSHKAYPTNEVLSQHQDQQGPSPTLGGASEGSSSEDPERFRILLAHLVKEMQQTLLGPKLADTEPAPSLQNLCIQMEELVECVRDRVEGTNRSLQWPVGSQSASDPLSMPIATRGESSSQGPPTYHPIPQSPSVGLDEPQAPNTNSGRIPPSDQLRNQTSSTSILPDRSRSGEALQSNLSVESHHLAQFRQSNSNVSMVSRDSSGTIYQVPSLAIGSSSSLGPCGYLAGDILAARNVRRSDFDVVYDPDINDDWKHIIRCAAGPLYREGSIADEWTFLPNGDLGEGASGKVKRASRIDNPETHSAVKIMDKADIDNKYVSREILSFRISSGSQYLPSCSNVVNLFGVYENNTKIYLVMELLSGGPLFRRISNRAHSEQECARIGRMMLSAIAYLHRMNITHRDIKPDNFVFCSDDDNADLKLTDFGISSYNDDPNASMRTMLGTPLYVAPEVFGRQPYGPEVDLWAVGVVVYQMLVGHPPFDHEDNVEIVNKVKYSPVTFDGKEWLCVSEAGKNFCARLLEKDPRKRPTAEMALHDDWILREGSLTDNKLNAAQENIMSYLSRQRWKKVANAIDAAGKFVAVAELTNELERRQTARNLLTAAEATELRRTPEVNGPRVRPGPAEAGASRVPRVVLDDKGGSPSSKKKGLFSCFNK